MGKLLLKARGLDRGSQPRSLSRERDRDRILFALDPKSCVFVIGRRGRVTGGLPVGAPMLSSLLESRLPPSVLDSILEPNDPLLDNGRSLMISLLDPSPEKPPPVGNISRFVLQQVKQCLRARTTVLPTSALWYVMSVILGDFFLF